MTTQPPAPESLTSEQEWEKEFDRKFQHEVDYAGYPCEFLQKNRDRKCNCQLKDIKPFISTQRQQVAEEATRKERERCLDILGDDLPPVNELVIAYNKAKQEFRDKIKNG